MGRNMTSFRFWLFRGLVAVAAGLMIGSFSVPWWAANMPDIAFIDPVRVYGYGFEHDLVELAPYVAMDVTPFYQTVLAWVYIAASVGLVLYSTWLRGRKAKWLLGGVGLTYIAYAAIAVIWVAIRTGDFAMSLQGHSLVQGEIDAYASLRFGYYLAYAAGGLFLVLALLRNIIVGRPKISA